jgi:hypothetical protein
LDDRINTYTNDLIKDTEEINTILIDKLILSWGFTPPDDYLKFMPGFVCGEGPVGENSWLTLWSMEKLASINSEYVIMREIPEYFIFGKDAADTGYVFNKRNSCIYEFGLMSNFNTDTIDFCGKNFSDFLEYLYNR